MEQRRRYHLIGIGGIGMSGLAKILAKRGHVVSGSDLKTNESIEQLKTLGVKIYLEHLASNVPQDAIVVYSTDIPQSNPELQEARSRGYRLLHRSQLLADLCRDHKTLAITGTHGKTTTSSLLAWILMEAHLSPSYALGGILKSHQTNADHGQSDYFVIEADESDRSFLNYTPYGGIITNIEWDHVDHYESLEETGRVFKEFSLTVPSNHLVWNLDDPVTRSIDLSGKTYGQNPKSDVVLSHYQQIGWKSSFRLTSQGMTYECISPLIGLHNAYNAASVFCLVTQILDLQPNVFLKALATFPGVKRRQNKVEVNNITWIDDYAHHPTEVAVTLKGVRAAVGASQLKVVFQPHRFSRITQFAPEFLKSFSGADEIILTDVYAAGEKGEFSMTDFACQMKSSYPHSKVSYVPIKQLFKYCTNSIKQGDTFMSMGAGSSSQIHYEIIDYFKDHEPLSYKVGIIFGGRSEEHSISILSAKNILSWMEQSGFQVELFYISRSGTWHYLLPQDSLNDLEELPERTETLTSEILTLLQNVDVVFPVMHGTYGEDGAIQGFLETLRLPYVGGNHLSCAVCMEKIWAKAVVKDQGIQVPEYVSIAKQDWLKSHKLAEEAWEKLKAPLFVKPPTLGSSIGISKVESYQEFLLAIEKAFEYDDWVLIEEGVIGAREVEFSVLGEGDYGIYGPGEIIVQDGFYDYEKKYIKTSEVMIKAKVDDLSQDIIKNGKSIVKKIAQALRCRGMVRIDMFLLPDGTYLFNEANPIPGMTRHSLYPSMITSEGLSSQQLMKELVFLALKQVARR